MTSPGQECLIHLRDRIRFERDARQTRRGRRHGCGVLQEGTPIQFLFVFGHIRQIKLGLQ